MTEEIISEWLSEVTAVGLQFRPGTPEFLEWKKRYDVHMKIMQEEAEVLRHILNNKLGPKGEETKMTEEQLKAFLELLMCSDPWPTDGEGKFILENFADEEAQQYGYTDWISAYHAL
ncbi:MAG TPA: hypothetical protein ACFYD4_08130 [Candidatus Wunengus sp. YC61]|uniref:hypothetical protein n=1 Tax=Candidatus Wunengus sp. YC61 TaxID=3367698 RepID=UPI00402861A1